MGREGRAPNLLVIVLDCARGRDFPEDRDPAAGFDVLQGHRKEFVRYSRSAAVTPWTIPTHASLFTGLHPWEHRVHLPGDLRLDPAIPTVAEVLREAGYATGCFSSNGFLSPHLGLTRGFDVAAWGDWWERFFRTPSPSIPPQGERVGRVQRLPKGPLWRSLEIEARFLNQQTLLLNLMNRGLRFLHDVPRGAPLPVSSWLEPTLERWVAGQPAERPIFCFVNLFDAHEPYLSHPRVGEAYGPWSRRARIRQDRANYFSGRFRPSPAEWGELRALYRETLAYLDRRVGRILRTFQDHGRWQETLVVVTSDHGQAFGEHEHMFHQAAVWEELLRVPLWVRFPGGARGGATVAEWTSSVDLAPTLLAAAGAPLRPGMGGRDLRELLDVPRRSPVLAVGDGVPSWDPLLAHSPPEVISRLQRPWAVAYHADLKVTLDPRDGSYQLYDLAKDPDTRAPRPAGSAEGFEEALGAAREAGARLLGQASVTQTDEVTDRLQSWGY